MVTGILIIAGIVVFVIYLLLSKKNDAQEREGLVKEVLNKDAFAVEFDGESPTVVKFHGITIAAENEMMDDKIFEFLYANVRGKRVLVKPNRIEPGDVVIAEIDSLLGESINEMMVRSGFARWNPAEAANERNLMEAQEAAKEAHVGIWNPAVRQLVEEKKRKAAAGDVDEDEDIANLEVNPDDYETKEDA